MWFTQFHTLPALNEQVIGLLAVDGGWDELAWWTRTADGWYASDNRGNLGRRDTMRKEDSKGPTIWTHAPSVNEDRGVDSVPTANPPTEMSGFPK